MPTVYNALVCAYLKWCGGVRNSLVQLFTFGVAYVVEVNKKSLIVVQEDGKIYSNSIRSGTITLETSLLGAEEDDVNTYLKSHLLDSIVEGTFF